MGKAEGEKKEFDPGDICDIEDELSRHSTILKAFGALLYGCSDFTDFSGEGSNSGADMRWGLQQFIHLYLEKQDRILREAVDSYYQSDYRDIGQGQNTITLVEQGDFKGQFALNELHKALSKFDVLIQKKSELSPLAEALRGKGLNLFVKLGGRIETHNAQPS